MGGLKEFDNGNEVTDFYVFTGVMKFQVPQPNAKESVPSHILILSHLYKDMQM